MGAAISRQVKINNFEKCIFISLQCEPLLQSADQDIKLAGLNDRFVVGANERQILAAQLEIYGRALTRPAA